MMFSLDSHIAITGRAESGKSSIARLIVEADLAAGERVCIIAPYDDWWGLRLTRGGRKPSGLNPIIFGGSRADIPLEPGSGAVIAELIASKSISTVISTAHLSTTARCRWFSDFLNALVRLNSEPLRLVLDDFDMYMVGIGGKYEAGALALKHLLGSKGSAIAAILITSQPYRFPGIAEDNITTSLLTRCAARLMIAETLRLIGYIPDPAADITIPEILPELQIGQAIQVSEERGTGLREFPHPRTFVSNRRLWSVGMRPREISTIRIKKWLKAIAGKNAPAPMKPIDHQHLRTVVDVAVQAVTSHRAGADIGFERCRAAVVDYLSSRGIRVDGLTEVIDQAKATLPDALIEQESPTLKPETVKYRAERLVRVSWVLGDGEKRVLTAIVQSPGCTAPTAALIAGMAASSGEFAASIGLLRRRKLIMPRLPLVPTVDGVDVLANLGDFELRPIGAALADWWSERLAPIDRVIFHAMLKARVDGDLTAFEIKQRINLLGGTGDILPALQRLREIGIVRGAITGRMSLSQAFGQDAPPVALTSP